MTDQYKFDLLRHVLILYWNGNPIRSLYSGVVSPFIYTDLATDRDRLGILVLEHTTTYSMLIFAHNLWNPIKFVKFEHVNWSDVPDRFNIIKDIADDFTEYEWELLKNTIVIKRLEL